LLVFVFFVENRSIVGSEQVNSIDLLIEFIHIKPQYFFKNDRSILFFLQLRMPNIGHQHDNHRNSIEPPFIGKIQSVDCEELLHDDDDAMQRFDAADPLPDSCSGADAKM